MGALGPRTTREALIAEMLGDLDALLARAEALPGQVAEAEAQMRATASALAEAGNKYRTAVTAFTEQAKGELTEYLERKATEVAARTGDEQRAALREVARTAFRSEASDRAAALSIALGAGAKEFRRSMWSRLGEHAITAGLAAGLTAAAVLLIVK